MFQINLKGKRILNPEDCYVSFQDIYIWLYVFKYLKSQAHSVQTLSCLIQESYALTKENRVS